MSPAVVTPWLRRALGLAAVAIGACGGAEVAGPVAPARAPAAPSTRRAPAAPSPGLEPAAGGTWLCRWAQWTECDQRCTQGNALSCARLGDLLSKGHRRREPGDAKAEQLDADPQKARAAYARSCDLGYARGCSSFAAMLGKGEGGPADLERSLTLLERACSGGDADACGHLGLRARDADTARRYLERACKLGDTESCGELAGVQGDRQGDARGALRSLRHMIKGAPVQSPRATARVACAAGAVATERATGLGGLGGPFTFCATPDGKREGPSIEWLTYEDLVQGAPHGVMTEEGAYHLDQRHGLFRRRHPNGKLAAEGEFRDDQEHGPWKLSSLGGLDQEGSFVAGKREGPWIVRDGHARWEGVYRDGGKDGVWIETLHGEKFREQTWALGKRHGTDTRTWPNGQRCVEKHAHDQETHRTCWHPNGRKSLEMPFRDGAVHGTVREWHESGALKAEQSYRAGKKHGRSLDLYESGRREERFYRDDKEVTAPGR
jgi:antitoxin component YwqK of YwqJK toxin-antitoxin module